MLQIEATLVPGKGGVTLTGKLGEVMQESARAGLTCVRSRAESLGLKKEDFTESDLHIHVPEGAIPKDGPSAGITMAVAIVSAMTKRRIRHDVAMTGEITLRGNVLPVGGIKEKLLAAHRYGLKTVLLSEQNQKDLVDVPDEIKEDMNIVFVRDLDEVVARVVEDSASDGVDGGSNLWTAHENGGELSVSGK